MSALRLPPPALHRCNSSVSRRGARLCARPARLAAPACSLGDARPAAAEPSTSEEAAPAEPHLPPTAGHVYACPVCQTTFHRWRNAMRHFKVRTLAFALPSSSDTARQDTKHWEVPEKGQRAAQRMRRNSKIQRESSG